MPAYNAAATIVAAAESILAEPIDDLILLVIDDGSVDGTGDAVRGIGDDRIEVIRQDNAGLVAALNRGLREARTEFLARMDADDLSVPGRIRAQLDWLAAHPDAVACGTDYELFGEMRGRVRVPRRNWSCRQRAQLSSAHCGASMVWRRIPSERAGMRFDPDYAHAEDYEYFSRITELGAVGNLPTVGYRYLIHDGQSSERYELAQHEAHLRVARRNAERAGLRPLPEWALRDLLWPQRDASGPKVGRTLLAALTIVRRRPGGETVRFAGRKVVEATAARWR